MSEINKVIEYKGKKLELVKNTNNGWCIGCYFYSLRDCSNRPSLPGCGGKIFKEVKEETDVN